ncbi:MAG: HIT family protein [Bacteroidia bacterium]|nr:HIT family protein [Bacteroidia bacterium]MCZ2247341.1 HIT family protein [Bacteroidia bacterium]
MATIFTQIIKGEIPCHKIAENDRFFAFLDIFPLRHGHTLVIPKTEVDYIFDMDKQEYKELMAFAQTISKAIKIAFPCKKVGMSVVGLEVPHAHIHLIPLNTVSDMNFNAEKLKPSNEELAKHAEMIRMYLQL